MGQREVEGDSPGWLRHLPPLGKGGRGRGVSGAPMLFLYTSWVLEPLIWFLLFPILFGKNLADAENLVDGKNSAHAENLALPKY